MDLIFLGGRKVVRGWQHRFLLRDLNWKCFVVIWEPVWRLRCLSPLASVSENRYWLDGVDARVWWIVGGYRCDISWGAALKVVAKWDW